MSQKGNANLHFTVLSRAQESDYSDCSGEKHLERDDSRLSFDRFPARFELTGGLAQHKKRAGQRPALVNNSVALGNPLVKESDELLASTWLLELSYRLCFNLTNTFASHFENVPHFFQGVTVAIPKTISELDDLSFAITQ